MSKKIDKMEFHKYCFFPVANQRTLNTMADDIARHGLVEPIMLYEGKILDGRCRFLACEMAEVEPHFVEFEDVKYGDPLQYVISKKSVQATFGCFADKGFDADGVRDGSGHCQIPEGCS
jgi:hypothetical protein